MVLCLCVSVEASVHGTSIHCSDKTFEAAEALLRMDSPSSLREDRSPGNKHGLIKQVFKQFRTAQILQQSL